MKGRKVLVQNTSCKQSCRETVFHYVHSASLAHEDGIVFREREREREIHYVHSASLAYEDGIVFMSEPSAARQ